jgi:hypothetical protein
VAGENGYVFENKRKIIDPRVVTDYAERLAGWIFSDTVLENDPTT